MNKDSNELVFYLVVRLLIMLLVTMVAESLAIFVNSALLIPALKAILGIKNMTTIEVTTSFAQLVRQLAVLLLAMARGDILQAVSFLRGSAAVAIALLMLVLMLLPPVLVALVLARMVSRRVRALQDIRERELMRQDQQRSQFMTDIAHDLRTPLMAISGMAQAVRDGVVRDDAMREEYLRSICDKADKMGGLVSSVFEYTKLGGGSYQLEREHIELPQLLLREAAVVYSDIEDAGQHLSVQVSEESCPVFADPTQLGRVVANLLVNAMRHTGPGTEIALLLVRGAGVAYVVVADTGASIEGDPDDLFQPFSRGDKARTTAGGAGGVRGVGTGTGGVRGARAAATATGAATSAATTSGSGLGLSICKRIADLHGFDLDLVQPYGRFTKAFVLRCPVVA